MAGTSGTREISKSYPVPSSSGTGAEDYHKGREINLIPQEASLVPQRDKENL